jgi:methyltransferase family protein
MRSSSRIPIERLRVKADIVNWLGWQAGYRSYLEIATPSTGFQFSLIAPDVFAEINRVVYHASPDFDDGQPVTCLGSSTDSSECLRQFVDQRRTFDLIFVDPWHTYESSLRDIQLALTLLAPEGMLVVHDCYPTTPELATPEYHPGAWMGQTYLAFLDVARATPELVHSVVDLDCGCGLLWRRHATGHGRQDDEVELSRAALVAYDYHDWATYVTHGAAILNLVPLAEFLRRHRCRPRSLASRLYHLVEPALEASYIFAGVSMAEHTWRKLQRASRRMRRLLRAAFVPTKR